MIGKGLYSFYFVLYKILLFCSDHLQFCLKANQLSRGPFHPDWGRYPRLRLESSWTRGCLVVGEGVPDVGGVAVLGAPTGEVADPLVAAEEGKGPHQYLIPSD